jgi:hypothetical protein
VPLCFVRQAHRFLGDKDQHRRDFGGKRRRGYRWLWRGRTLEECRAQDRGGAEVIFIFILKIKIKIKIGFYEGSFKDRGGAEVVFIFILKVGFYEGSIKAYEGSIKAK